jgi:hypothetical protein
MAAVQIPKDIQVQGNVTVDENLTVGSQLVSDGSVGLPTSTGTNGQYLISNGAGGTSWASGPSYTVTTITDATATLTAGHDRVLVNGGCTITLPDISGLQSFRITNADGTAATNPCTLVAGSGNTILGQATFTLRGAYFSVEVWSDGSTKWFF